MSWFRLPDTGPRSPLIELRLRGRSTSIFELSAGPEFALNGLLLKHVGLWIDLLPVAMPGEFDATFPGQYAVDLSRLRAAPETGHVDSVELLDWLRHPLVDGVPADNRRRGSGSWWSRPSTPGWREADQALDVATRGRYSGRLRELDSALALIQRGVEAMDASVEAGEPWCPDFQLCQYAGASKWPAFIEHVPLVGPEFVDAVGGMERLTEWGASLVEVSLVDRSKVDRSGEFRLLVPDATVDEVTSEERRRAMFARIPWVTGVAVNDLALERLRGLFPKRASFERVVGA